MPDDKQYVFMSVKAIRGREATKIAEHQNSGWELVDQNRGTLQTTLNFRRERPTTFGSRAWAAFRRLDRKTQLRLGVGTAGLIVVLLAAGVIAAVVADDDQRTDATATQSPTQPAAVPSKSSTPTTTSSPSASSKAYHYAGPKYEIVTVDEDINSADLDQYWVYTRAFDYSTDTFRQEVKAIIADVARGEGTDKLVVQVVTDKEIIEAESNETIEAFTGEHDQAYFNSVIVPKEKAHWVAVYSGGFDPDEGQASDADDAFEITWLADEIQGIEKWKPAL